VVFYGGFWFLIVGLRLFIFVVLSLLVGWGGQGFGGGVGGEREEEREEAGVEVGGGGERR